MKYVLVCGGVVSGVGKGIVASSIGRALQEEGYTVTVVKIDPYLNYDAGTLGPRDHGEVFVLDDGTETDLDLGNYERFLGINLTRLNTITSGRMYEEVLAKERSGEYLGSTVQVVPHLTNHMIINIEKASVSCVDKSGTQPDVCIIELGGVVGDIESITFIEALRQLLMKAGKSSFVVVGVDYALDMNKEYKTKPIQSAAKRARELGIAYDAIVCRSKGVLPQETVDKIVLFTGVEYCVQLVDGNVLHVPKIIKENGLTVYIRNKLCLEDKQASRHTEQPVCLSTIVTPKDKVCKVAVVGKYKNYEDAYLSIKESLKFAGACEDVNTEVCIKYFDAAEFVCDDGLAQLQEFDGIVVPGGFGKRGTEEIVKTIEYARVHKIPILGICLGMQLMAIEYARNVVGMQNATSEEFVTEEDVHTIIDDKINLENMPLDTQTYMCIVKKHSDTIRIGKQQTKTVAGTRIAQIYGTNESTVQYERYRHRYGIAADITDKLEQAGMRIGMQTDKYIDGVEATDHPFFIGVQFHPEFLSKPLEPRPLFISFLIACMHSK